MAAEAQRTGRGAGFAPCAPHTSQGWCPADSTCPSPGKPRMEDLGLSL